VYALSLIKISRMHGNPRLPPGDRRNRTNIRKDIEEYHIAYDFEFNHDLLFTFLSRKPKGLAFDKGKNLIVFLEFTRVMEKEAEKDARCCTHLGLQT